MSYKIILLAIPGIGTKEEGFSDPLKEDIEKYSRNTVLHHGVKVLEARPFNETKVDENQDKLYDRLERHNRLGGILSFRKFVLKAFGDGVTFESGADEPNSVYKKVHEIIRKKVIEANGLLQDNPGAKLVIVAASMGVHLLSTYIWDADNAIGIFKGKPATQDENLHNLSYLFTIGCNLPLFYSGMDPDKLQPFDVGKRAPEFKWDNYYDRDDVLGWPLGDINSAFDAIIEDFEINTGLYVGSHMRYWKDRDFTKPLVKSLLAVVG